MFKNLIYLLILLLLGFLTYYFVIREDKQDFSKDEANFTIDDIDQVSTILLTNLQGNKIKFTKRENEWFANDSVEIIQSKMNDLLEALRDQKAIQPVNLGSHDQVVKDMSSNNTKVEVYAGEKKLSTFYVAKTTAPNNLTYMLTEGAKRPYIVKLPLQNIFLGVRYSAELNDWRSRKIMHASADEIEMIDVRYKDSTQYSFHLTHEKGKNPVIAGNQTINQPLNLKRVNTYLGLWDSIYCFGFEMRNRIKDTILTSGRELATISMKKANKPIQTLTIYFKPVTKGTKAILKIGSTQFDFDVFIGFLNQRDMLVISRKYAQMMLRSYPEFFEEDNKQ